MTDYVKNPHTIILTDQTGCGKTHLVLDLIEKEYKNILTTLPSSAQHFELIKRTMPGTGSKMMTRFDL